MAAEVVVERDGGRVVVRKVPLAGDHHDREAEADWLRRAAGDGVVQLVTQGPAPIGIVTVHAGSHTWRTARPGPVQGAALLASVLRTVAELHRRGLVHGALVADHVIVSNGGAVLCSPEPGLTEASQDRVALAELAAAAHQRWRSDGIPVPDEQRWDRVVELLASPTAGWSLDDIAAVLDPSVTPSSSRRRAARHHGWSAPGGQLRWLVPAVVVLAGALALWTQVSVSRPAPPAAVDGPSVELAGARYRAGRGDDVLAATERPCPDSAPAAVLEPGTGVVWAFRRLPFEDAPEGGEAVQQVPGASTLDVRNDGTCQRLVVTGPAGEAPVPLPQE